MNGPVSLPRVMITRLPGTAWPVGVYHPGEAQLEEQARELGGPAEPCPTQP